MLNQALFACNAIEEEMAAAGWGSSEVQIYDGMKKSPPSHATNHFFGFYTQATVLGMPPP